MVALPIRVDTVCISQCDLDEHSRVVPRMREVYPVHNVMICLGGERLLSGFIPQTLYDSQEHY
jgi:hypothetical protein